MKIFLRGTLAILFLIALVWVGLRLDPLTLRQWLDKTPFLPFFVALALLTLLGIPPTPFFLVAGAAYGVLPALLGTVAALSANLLLSYGIAATGLRTHLKKQLDRTRFSLPEELPGKGLRFSIMVRLLPAVPWFLKNYVLCLAGVPFPIYFVVSLISSLVYAAPLIILGESVFERDYREVLAWLLVLAVLLVAAHFGARRLVDKPKQ